MSAQIWERSVVIFIATMVYLSWVLSFNSAMQMAFEGETLSIFEKIGDIFRYQLLGSGLVLYIFIIFCVSKIMNKKEFFLSFLALVILTILHFFVTVANAHTDTYFYFMQIVEIIVSVLLAGWIFIWKKPTKE